MNLEKNKKRAKYVWRQFLSGVGRHLNYGIDIYEESWDVVIIIDACRYDLFESFAPDHSLYNQFDSVIERFSCASSSQEWMQRTFTSEEVRNTALVTANGYSRKVDLGDFEQVDEVWRYAHDSELGTVPPTPVTDAAIRMDRESDPERMIVHYVQPHAPFLHCPGKYNSIGDGKTQNLWSRVEAGEFTVEEVWKDYGQNLLTVLNHVETLVENLDGDIVVTSDHGNAIGEWGIYGHPEWLPLPAVKRVPWCVTNGKGNDEYEPTHRRETEEIDVSEHLQDLGYLDE